ncbi:MAG: DUF3299 domain-containing protein [Flavobacteriales bacterium]|nr:hypothetical protein [Flavobacteriales bacterium]MCB9190116.1 DUF3299 domain-containing protein [Flavobacteriales bacterium]MCB9205091.1 DUF3299 domain-containing protein [Flavobacteriales bacterium]
MRFLLTVFLIVSSGFVSAQTLVSWNTFAQVTFHKEYSETFGFEVNVKPPEFSKELMALNGKEVKVKGYVIPVDVELGMYMVSANPFANCFFCGNAGPETVVELFPNGKFPRFSTDQIVTFKGVLQINTQGEMNAVPYQLFQAEMVK